MGDYCEFKPPKPIILVLGVGLIGGFIANELARDFTVYAVDINNNNLDKLNYGIYKINEGVINEIYASDLYRKIEPAVVVNALPGWNGYDAFVAAIKDGVDIVDISFMKENPLNLDLEARNSGSRAVVDFGFAPGFSHMFVGRANHYFEKHLSSEIYVAGLQKNSNEYKAVFSPEDIVEEYTREARYITNGMLRYEQPFARNYPFQRWSCFINDGLRTMTQTLEVENLIELTMRPNSHFKFIQELIRNGFFDEDMKQQTARKLAQAWRMRPEDRDQSIMHVISKGIVDDEERTVRHAMLDEYDEENNIHSMARVTGLPVIAMVKLILKGHLAPGVHPPEWVAQDDYLYYNVVEYLQNRGVTIKETKIG